jgi:hypothetical protein
MFAMDGFKGASGARGNKMKIIKLLLIVVIAFTALIGFRWHRYVTNTESPYNEIGIELNSRMPSPIQKWGCDQLHKTFGNVIPPYGCQTVADGRQWI